MEDSAPWKTTKARKRRMEKLSVILALFILYVIWVFSASRVSKVYSILKTPFKNIQKVEVYVKKNGTQKKKKERESLKHWNVFLKNVVSVICKTY